MYDEDEELGGGFKVEVDENESLDVPEEMTDFGLDEEDPDRDH